MSPLPIAPGLRPLAVETDTVYIAGFPVHVAVTIAGPGNTTFHRLPYADFISDQGAFGVKLSTVADGSPIASIDPADALDEDLGMSAITLRPGEQRRMLIDLSGFFPAGSQPGEYQGILSYGPLETRTLSAPFRLMIYAPDQGQKAELALLANDLREAGSWGQWTLRPPSNPDLFTAPDGSDPLRFNRIVKGLLFTKDFPIEALRVLTGLYRPEGAALAADLLASREDDTAYRSLVDDIRQRFPGLEWWLKKTESGASRVRFYRSSL